MTFSGGQGDRQLLESADGEPDLPWRWLDSVPVSCCPTSRCTAHPRVSCPWCLHDRGAAPNVLVPAAVWQHGSLPRPSLEMNSGVRDPLLPFMGTPNLQVGYDVPVSTDCNSNARQT